MSVFNMKIDDGQFADGILSTYKEFLGRRLAVKNHIDRKSGGLLRNMKCSHIVKAKLFLILVFPAAACYLSHPKKFEKMKSRLLRWCGVKEEYLDRVVGKHTFA